MKLVRPLKSQYGILILRLNVAITMMQMSNQFYGTFTFLKSVVSLHSNYLYVEYFD